MDHLVRHGVRVIMVKCLYYIPHLGQPGADELQHGHLRGGVLPQPQVDGAPLNVLTRGVIHMGVEDPLWQGRGSV